MILFAKNNVYIHSKDAHYAGCLSPDESYEVLLGSHIF